MSAWRPSVSISARVCVISINHCHNHGHRPMIKTCFNDTIFAFSAALQNASIGTLTAMSISPRPPIKLSARPRPQDAPHRLLVWQGGMPLG